MEEWRISRYLPWYKMTKYTIFPLASDYKISRYFPDRLRISLFIQPCPYDQIQVLSHIALNIISISICDWLTNFGISFLTDWKIRDIFLANDSRISFFLILRYFIATDWQISRLFRGTEEWISKFLTANDWRISFFSSNWFSNFGFFHAATNKFKLNLFHGKILLNLNNIFLWSIDGICVIYHATKRRNLRFFSLHPNIKFRNVSLTD